MRGHQAGTRFAKKKARKTILVTFQCPIGLLGNMGEVLSRVRARHGQAMMVLVTLVVTAINLSDGQTNAAEEMMHFAGFVTFLRLCALGP